MTCRVLYGAYGALTALRSDGADTLPETLKDAFATFRLLASRHTTGLRAFDAIAIAERARVHKLDPFDVWMLYDQGACSLDDAVLKALEMRAFYQIDPLDVAN